jgi:putative two-component system response regulator
MSDRKPQAEVLAGVQSSFRIVAAIRDHATRNALLGYLQPFGYEVLAVPDGRDALATIHAEDPDLVVADAHAESHSGLELARLLKRNPATQGVPVLLAIPPNRRADRVRALNAGADDFLELPIDEVELRARVRSLLRLRTLHQRLQNEKSLVEVRLRERTRELREITLGLVAALEKASELNDTDTGSHILRVCEVSALLADTMGLPAPMVDKIRLYASLHDIGKVGVPDSILKKQAGLSPEEWEEMKRHTVYGYELLVAAKADPVAQNIAFCHHEKFDGTGYPRSLRGRQIPVEARIVALADVYDALVNKRCYKEPIPEPIAIQMVVRQSNRHFDPDIVSAFRARLTEIREIHRRFGHHRPDAVTQALATAAESVAAAEHASLSAEPVAVLEGAP